LRAAAKGGDFLLAVSAGNCIKTTVGLQLCGANLRAATGYRFGKSRYVFLVFGIFPLNLFA
jgi:hypothetical protein